MSRPDCAIFTGKHSHALFSKRGMGTVAALMPPDWWENQQIQKEKRLFKQDTWMVSGQD